MWGNAGPHSDRVWIYFSGTIKIPGQNNFIKRFLGIAMLQSCSIFKYCIDSKYTKFEFGTQAIYTVNLFIKSYTAFRFSKARIGTQVQQPEVRSACLKLDLGLELLESTIETHDFALNPEVLQADGFSGFQYTMPARGLLRESELRSQLGSPETENFGIISILDLRKHCRLACRWPVFLLTTPPIGTTLLGFDGPARG